MKYWPEENAVKEMVVHNGKLLVRLLATEQPHPDYIVREMELRLEDENGQVTLIWLGSILN